MTSVNSIRDVYLITLRDGRCKFHHRRVSNYITWWEINFHQRRVYLHYVTTSINSISDVYLITLRAKRLISIRYVYLHYVMTDVITVTDVYLITLRDEICNFRQRCLSNYITWWEINFHQRRVYLHYVMTDVIFIRYVCNYITWWQV